MHPLMMAALISGGVNALQGKRGSDLLKSTVRDTAIAAALRAVVLKDVFTLLTNF